MISALTELRALIAAVEVAGAGDQGRVFAVRVYIASIYTLVESFRQITNVLNEYPGLR